ncbi:carboxypeptidase D [Desulfopila aestuarii DSM 18488]|uniref:Carboxypeptidase D n=2 Tax=Desulfopila aestuarii TaxID=231440 RepID=A0A1M7YH59_9BACT|nr:carboxypeptidase D [Desulfopila aestuarii DSM 18488]
MQCERLLKLAKTWYISVKEETMAPARMVSFMEKHAAECPVCQDDPDIQDEIAKITEIILPESKIPKAVRMQNEAVDDDEEDEDEDDDEDTDDDSEEEDEDDVYDDDEDFEDEPDLDED